MIKKFAHIIDCTLRDGGYYNNWEFSKELVEDYLLALSKVGVKFIEIGFRSSENKKFKGPTWHSTDNYLNSIKIPRKIELGVMVNASEIINKNEDYETYLKKIFLTKKKSKLNFIRVASHFEEVSSSIKICKILKKMGYFVFLNLMQISEYNEEKLKIVSKKISKSDIDVFYIADSLGSLKRENLKDIIQIISKNCNTELGIHAHDNLSLALDNTLYAKNLGVRWLDSTVLGMGRGPGNAKTESLILEILKTDIYPITKLIERYFLELKKKYNWGTNIYYYLAAKYSIHPTYVQELLKISLDSKEILKVLNNINKVGGQRYNVNLIKSEFQKPIKFKNGKWSPIKSFKNKNILIIAPGKISEEYKSELKNYIKNNRPAVIALSPNIDFDKKLINFFVACNPLKMFSETDFYKKLKAPMILPFSLLSDKYKKKFSKLNYLDYGVGVNNYKFIFKSKGSYIPKLFNLAYVLAISASGKAKNIFLVGFDGMNYNVSRKKEIEELFFSYASSKGSIPIHSLTPTPYGLNSKSIFSLVYDK